MLKKKENKGITLIALVITVIVLLILAGISISMLTGQNGILNRAQEAKEKTEEAVLEEKIRLLTAETLINEYTGQEEEKTAQELQNELNNQGENVLVIQWDKYIIFDLNKNKEYRVMNDGTTEYWGESIIGETLLNAKTANSDQVAQDSSTSNIIGIDNDGNTVNMLLWEKKLIDDSALGKVGTYGLNDKNGLDSSGESGRSAGYIGEYTEDGRIIGTVPAYISEDGGNSYISVTSMVHTFYACNDLIIAPEIADTVTNMQVTFYQASNLTTGPSKIPDSVVDLSYAFASCEKLSNVPILGKNIIDMNATFIGAAITEFTTEIPNGVREMGYALSDCTSLKTFTSIIPNTVIDMSSTFRNCTALVTGPSSIPDNVINMGKTFYNCKSLVVGPSSIPDKVTNMESTFYNCRVMTNIPTVIPSSVTNMFQTFSKCYNLQGKIEINANIGEDIVLEYNGEKFKGYDQTFLNAGTNGNGITIEKESKCRTDILEIWINGNDKLSIQ